MAITFQQLFTGKNLTDMTALVNAYIGKPDALLEAILQVPGVPALTRTALTKPSTKNALNGLAPIEYLACGLLKHSTAHPNAQILEDWAMGAAGTPMRMNRIRILAVSFFS
ncbi:hypothetical protein [Burkholderia phage FLC9]|nr:hypothetical protein [Burkholderia phage FLC9]